MNSALPYIYLILAIVAEVIATSALKASDTFTRLVPSIITVVVYVICYVFLSLAMRTFATSIVYAIWSGVGIVLIAAIGWIWFKQALDLAAIIGMGLIIAGVVVVNVFSNTTGN